MNRWHFDFRFTLHSFGIGFLVSKSFGYWEIYITLGWFEISIDNPEPRKSAKETIKELYEFLGVK